MRRFRLEVESRLNRGSGRSPRYTGMVMWLARSHVATIQVHQPRELDFITKLISTYATKVSKLEVVQDVDSRREDSSTNQSALPKILDEPPL